MIAGADGEFVKEMGSLPSGGMRKREESRSVSGASMESQRVRLVKPAISVGSVKGGGVEDEAVAVEVGTGLSGIGVWIVAVCSSAALRSLGRGEEGCAGGVGLGGGERRSGRRWRRRRWRRGRGSFGLVGDGGEGVGVLPVLCLGAADVVGDVVLEEGRFHAGLGKEVVPLAVEAECYVEERGGGPSVVFVARWWLWDSRGAGVIPEGR